MKKLLFALLFFISFSQVIAQDTTVSVSSGNGRMSSNTPLKLSFGLDGGAPLGDNSKLYSFIIGGDLQLEFGLTQNFKLTASGGVDVFVNKGGLVETIYYAPMLGGLRFYFTDKIYISEQAGYSLALTKDLEGVFTNVAGLGYRFTKSSDVLIGYKSLFAKKGGKDINIFAIRLAYVFGK